MYVCAQSGLFQTIILEWVYFLFFSEDLLNPGIKPLSLASPIFAGGFFYHFITWEALSDLPSYTVAFSMVAFLNQMSLLLSSRWLCPQALSGHGNGSHLFFCHRSPTCNCLLLLLSQVTMNFPLIAHTLSTYLQTILLVKLPGMIIIKMCYWFLAG